MKNIPNSVRSKESKHPLIKEYDSFFTNNSTFEEREKLIFDFYNRNQEFVNNIEEANSNLIIQKLIEIKIFYVRSLDGKREYKKCEPICKQIKILLSKLSKDYYKYDFLYQNGYKWVAINLGRLNRYLESNKIFKELIKTDENKEFYINWISSNYYGLILYRVIYPILTITSIIFIWNATINLFIQNYNWYIPEPYSSINSILFFIAVLLYFNLTDPIKYLVKKKYK